MIDINSSLKEINSISLNQESENINDNDYLHDIPILEDFAFFVHLPNPTNFFKLKNVLNFIRDGEHRYAHFMKKFKQSPKPDNKAEYSKAIEVIKSILMNDLYKNYADKINGSFAIELYEKMRPIFKESLNKELSNNVKTNLGTIASILCERKEINEPQIELLKKYLLEKAEELNLDKENLKIEMLDKSGHANAVYLISNAEIDKNDPNTIDYYAKSFSIDDRINAKKGLIDPNELFVYKILEYTGFGPECWFLMKTWSYSNGTISGSNFILTRNIGKGKGVDFLLDNKENKEVLEVVLSKNRKFAIEISASAAITDIVSIWDTFSNSGNYGVVFYNNSLENFKNKIVENKQIEENDLNVIEDFKIMFIDHLPNAGNDILSELNSWKHNNDKRYNTMYSPRESIISCHKDKPNKLIQLANTSRVDEEYSKSKIINDVYKRLNNNESDDKQQLIKFKEVLEKAKEDVKRQIADYRVNFYSSKDKNANKILEDYYEKILNNLEIFLEKYKEDIDKDSYGIQKKLVKECQT